MLVLASNTHLPFGSDVAGIPLILHSLERGTPFFSIETRGCAASLRKRSNQNYIYSQSHSHPLFSCSSCVFLGCCHCEQDMTNVQSFESHFHIHHSTSRKTRSARSARYFLAAVFVVFEPFSVPHHLQLSSALSFLDLERVLGILEHTVSHISWVVLVEASETH
jgi:hypothetical protein